MRYSGRLVGEPQDQREQMKLLDDRRATHLSVDSALGDDTPDWWLRLGESDWMLLAFGEAAALARSPEAGGLEFEHLGSLVGGRYKEEWKDDRGTVTFTHDRLPKPVTITLGGQMVERDKRTALKRWAQPI